MKNRELNYWQPMAHPAASKSNPPKIITAAEGVEIIDVDGHRALDAVGGLWNVNLGYSCQSIKDAINQQLEKLPYYSSFPGAATDKAIELSHALGEWFHEDGLHRAFFTSGGSDSVESALRLARQYHKIRGDKDRYKFISLKKGYHGTHFGGASRSQHRGHTATLSTNRTRRLWPRCVPIYWKMKFSSRERIRLPRLSWNRYWAQVAS